MLFRCVLASGAEALSGFMATGRIVLSLLGRFPRADVVWPGARGEAPSRVGSGTQRDWGCAMVQPLGNGTGSSEISGGDVRAAARLRGLRPESREQGWCGVPRPHPQQHRPHRLRRQTTPAPTGVKRMSKMQSIRAVEHYRAFNRKEVQMKLRDGISSGGLKKTPQTAWPRRQASIPHCCGGWKSNILSPCVHPKASPLLLGRLCRGAPCPCLT